MAGKPNQPHLIIVAGPNGAGKSMAAPALLARTLKVLEFVNADVIARGLSGFDPDRSAIEAAEIMFTRLRDLARVRHSFAFETTLSGRTLAPWLRDLRKDGYAIHLHYLWVTSSDLAVARVRQRVAQGGHDVPEETIRRRYYRSVQNFFDLYRPLTTTWRCYDNSDRMGCRLVASGRGGRGVTIRDRGIWQNVVEMLKRNPRK